MECTGSWNEDYETLAEWERMGLCLPTINDVVCDLEPDEYEEGLFDALEEPDTDVIALGIAVGVGMLGFCSAIELLREMGILSDD